MCCLLSHYCHIFIALLCYIVIDTGASIVGKASSASIPWADLASLLELNPPSVMPKGNVGTSLSTFMALIRACRLPARLIKKLQLEFPKSRSSKKYGAVAFEYEGRRYERRNECVGGRKRTCGTIRKGVCGGGGITADGTHNYEDAGVCNVHDDGACGDGVRKDGGGCEDNSDDDDDDNDDIPSVSVTYSWFHTLDFLTRKRGRGEERKIV